MNNNDIFKKLRVALQLRDDQIVEIFELVDFRISKGEIGNFFRNEDHPKYMDCGDQVLRNFLNALVIHLRGTKENPKNPMDVIKKHKANQPQSENSDKKDFKPKTGDKKPFKPKTNSAENSKKPAAKPKFTDKKPAKKNPVEKFKFSQGKPKK